MTQVFSRCLYFLILLCQLRIPNIAVDNVGLDFKPFAVHEHDGSLHQGINQLVSFDPDDLFPKNEFALGIERGSAHDSRDSSGQPLLPLDIQNELGAVEGRGPDGGFSSEVENPAAGGPPSLLLNFLHLAEEYFGVLSDTVIDSLETWRPDHTFPQLPLEAIVFATVLEILLVLVFIWNTVRSETSPPGAEKERDWYLKKLLAEERRSQRLEERLEALEQDRGALEGTKAQLEAQNKTLEQRLEVLHQLYQEKEEALWGKLIQEQIDQQETEKVLNTYKQRIQDVRQEQQRSESSYKAWIEFHQRRAYFNLEKACSLEHTLEQERRETRRLQQLVAMSVRLAEFQLAKDTTVCSDVPVPDPEKDVSIPQTHLPPNDGPPTAQVTNLKNLLPALVTPLNTPLPALATPLNRSLPLHLG